MGTPCAVRCAPILWQQLICLMESFARLSLRTCASIMNSPKKTLSKWEINFQLTRTCFNCIFQRDSGDGEHYTCLICDEVLCSLEDPQFIYVCDAHELILAL